MGLQTDNDENDVEKTLQAHVKKICLVGLVSSLLSCGDAINKIKGVEDEDDKNEEPTERTYEAVTDFFLGQSDFGAAGSPRKYDKDDFLKQIQQSDHIFDTKPEAYHTTRDKCLEELLDEQVTFNIEKNKTTASFHAPLESCEDNETKEGFDTYEMDGKIFLEMTCNGIEAFSFSELRNSELPKKIFEAGCDSFTYLTQSRLELSVKGTASDDGRPFETSVVSRYFDGKFVTESCTVQKNEETDLWVSNDCQVKLIDSQTTRSGEDEVALVLSKHTWKHQELAAKDALDIPYYASGSINGVLNNWQFELTYSDSQKPPSLTAETDRGTLAFTLDEISPIKPDDETSIRLKESLYKNHQALFRAFKLRRP